MLLSLIDSVMPLLEDPEMSISVVGEVLPIPKLPDVEIDPEAAMLPELIEPVMFTDVEPMITDAPLIVPDVINGLLNVLLVRVSVAVSVTTTPVVGNVAVELTPVPPLAVAKVPDVIKAAE